MSNTIKHNKKKISLIVPYFNEVECIPLFYNETKKILNKINSYEFEIIFIDDGSSDNSLLYLLGLLDKDKTISIIELSRNFGKEAALTAGIDIANGDAVIPIDVDLQDPPLLIAEMIKQWENGFDVVLARRTNRNNDSFLKRFSANFFYKIYAWFINNKDVSNVGDYRLIDRKVVESIKNLKEKNRFMKGLLSWPGFKTGEVKYIRNKRVEGKSKFNFLKLLNLGFEGITSFSIAPLKFFTIIGLIGCIISLLLSLIIIIQKFYYGYLIEGYAFVVLLILFFGSFQLLGIGILGEYIGKIYLETKNRPIYIIKKYYNKR